ncbi:MAG: hypothetical protein KDK70_18820 [Myxococcales bacterium]|nr:hypothetical protein [Myxococcales bacterium]
MARPAVGLAERRLEGPPLNASLTEVLVRLVDRTRSVHLLATGERPWVDLVVALAAGGRREVLGSIANGVGDIGYSHQVERAIEGLLRTGHVDELWDVLAAKLAEDPAFAIPLEHVMSQTSFRERLSVDRIMAWVGRDLGRGASVARLTSPDARTLDPLAHALIELFGADSWPARAITARSGSTPGIDGSARFYERQAENAAEWARSSQGEVARWASRLAAQFRERAEAEREEDELMQQIG